MADKGDSSGAKSVIIFLALVAIIALTCFVPMQNGRPLVHSCLPVTGGGTATSGSGSQIIMGDFGVPLENVTNAEQERLDRLIKESTKKKKK
jgi:hypothetical protein